MAIFNLYNISQMVSNMQPRLLLTINNKVHIN